MDNTRNRIIVPVAFLVRAIRFSEGSDAVLPTSVILPHEVRICTYEYFPPLSLKLIVFPATLIKDLFVRIHQSAYTLNLIIHKLSDVKSLIRPSEFAISLS